MTPASPPSTRLSERLQGRDNNIDFLRAFLAVSVLFYHCYPLLLGWGTPDPLGRATHGRLWGGAAVGGFFLLSGFLVTQSFGRSRTAGEYLLKRVLRIYPGFAGASLFCALVVGPLGADDVSVYFHRFPLAHFLSAMLLLVGPFLPPILLHVPVPNAVDGSFWTLRYEFECYLFVLLAGLTGLLRRRATMLTATVLVLVLTGVPMLRASLFPFHEYRILGNPASWAGVLGQFLLGVTVYLYRDHVRLTRLGFVLTALLTLAALFLPQEWLVPLLPVLIAYLLLFVAFSPRLPLHNFARGGDFSYGIYLYAFPIQQLLIQHLGPHLTPVSLFFITLLLSTTAAAVSWHFVEEPCLRLKPIRTMPMGAGTMPP